MNESDIHGQARMLLIGRVRDARMRPAVVLPADASIRAAAQAMSAHQVSCVLVRRDARLAIVTGSDIRDALALHGGSPDQPAAAIAHEPVLTVGSGELLMRAMLLMERHRVRRLVVSDAPGAALGVVEQHDVLGLLSTHADAIALRIGEALSPAELKPALDGLLQLVATLHRNGLRVDALAGIASEINAAIFARVFELVMPEEVRANTCLVVMGSEGRGEQVLPTDQDNALVVRDGYTHPDLPALSARLSAALVELGYPPCPGDIMVSNPQWVRSETAFRERVREWLVAEDNDSVMNLAIFFDAMAVAGDRALLAGVKHYLLERLAGRDAFFARFASAIAAFPTPLRMFSRFRLERTGVHAGMLDLKKGGIFPIVHGVRSFAIEKRLNATGTLERLALLEQARTIEAAFVRELGEALLFLMSLRVSTGLAARAAGAPPDNYVRPADLPRMEQVRLRDALRVVGELRDRVRHHFRLDLLGF